MTYGRCNILKDWPDWDSSVHEQEAQISRQGRAMTYPFSFEVDEKARAARFSSTSDLPYYETTLCCCTCYDFQGRHLPCKHMYRLASELGIIEIIKRSPSHYDKERLDNIRFSSDINSQPDQIKRIQSAKSSKTAPLSVDYNAQTGVFSGSGKKPYNTTLTSCTCRDYFVRRLPCKHMYRLMIELNLLEI